MSETPTSVRQIHTAERSRPTHRSGLYNQRDLFVCSPPRHAKSIPPHYLQDNTMYFITLGLIVILPVAIAAPAYQ